MKPYRNDAKNLRKCYNARTDPGDDRWWPVVDFIKGQDVISVKSCDTRQASDFIIKLRKDADSLFDLEMTNANQPIARRILDIRVQPGGLSHPGVQEVKSYAEGLGLEVVIKEFP